MTVIIVNFNGGEYLLQCLSCLAEQDTPPEQIVLINNCSTDGSAAAAREWVARDGRLTARLESRVAHQPDRDESYCCRPGEADLHR